MNAELLAPAGSYDSMKAAYAAGADAVYIGGSRFGARAYADNLDEEKMLQAIDYAHLKGRKLYLTVNTLVKDEEFEELYSYLNPFYREGLDAVIVQDIGVMEFIKREFPQTDIHASTQMTVTGEYGAAFLKEHGASRVVTARELSFKEIRKIHEKTGVEIESFIHGALCYCYSGQCLYSSMIGGRSGNRGRCAQPCRLVYQLTDGKKILNQEKNKYLLSPKDICTLEILPDILENGVYSLKIEGRMKRPEYTAGVVRIYRKYLDRILEHGAKNYHVRKEDMEELMDLYNRGGFSKGYYGQHNGPDMMSMERPNHWGTQAAKIIVCQKGSMKLKALEQLHNKDVLEYRHRDQEITFNMTQSVEKGQEFSLKVPGNQMLSQKNSVLYRTRNEELLKELENEFLIKKYSEKIYGKLILIKGKSAILKINFRDIQVEVQGAIPDQAQKRPLLMEDVEKQMRKTGGTGFLFEELEIEMDEDLFLPMQALNELRRNGIQELERAIKKMYQRDSVSEAAGDRKVSSFDENKPSNEKQQAYTAPYISVSVESTEKLAMLMKYPEIKKVYLDNAAFRSREDLLSNAVSCIELCHKSGKQCYYTMPWIFRETAKNYYAGQDMLDILEAFDGILLKSMEEYQFLKEKNYRKELVADYNLYTWNQEAKAFWKQNGIAYDTIPLELNQREIRRRGCNSSEILVYGYLPLMVSAQCQIKNHPGCSRKEAILYLRDRKQKVFPVTNRCSFCYNIIYNSTPLELVESSRDILQLQPQGVRLHFTMENEWEMEQIIRDYAAEFCNQEKGCRNITEFTRGHFKRGVE